MAPSSPDPLPAVSAPIALFPTLIARHSETLIMREKIWSLTGDSFDIKLLDGTPVLKVDGKAMSMSNRKRVFDAQGNHLCDIVQEFMHWHRTFKVVLGRENDKGAIEEGSGREVVVKNNFSLRGSKTTATFTSMNGKEETLVMKGSFFATKAEITDESSGAVVARIDCQWLHRNEYIFGQQTYAVQVAPGVDMALIATLCVCLDERNEPGT